MQNREVIVVRGGGDMASATICRLHASGFKVLILERNSPTAIRRKVSFCEAAYNGNAEVEGITAVRVLSLSECDVIWQKNQIPLLVDPEGETIQQLAPGVVVDAILAKKNLGTTMGMAPITIGLGPGFCAGKDVHAVIETVRGHDLGRVIYTGSTSANTGIPGDIKGYTHERVIYAPISGELRLEKDISERVEVHEVIASIDGKPLHSPFKGVVRGILRDRSRVEKGLKIADIDPRFDQPANAHRISEKARCISGGVLEAILHLQRRKR